MFPAYYMGPLQGLGLEVPGGGTSSLPPGRCLGLWRRLDVDTLARKLRVRAQAISLVESLSWPVPPEWLPTLHASGFSCWMPGDLAPLPRALCAQDPRRREAAILAMSSGKTLREAARRADVCEATAARWRQGAGLGDAPPNPLRERVRSALTSRGAVEGTELLRGQWLGRRRADRGAGTRDVAHAVGTQAKTLEMVEKYNLVLPPEWLGGLQGLKLLDYLAEAAIPPAETGRQLGSFCRAQGIWVENLAALLGAKSHVAHMVLYEDLPLCPEWVPALEKIGMPLTAPAPTPAAAPALLCGSFLKDLRELENLTAARLASLLKISKQDLTQIEESDLVIPPHFLAILKRHDLLSEPAADPPAERGRALLQQMQEANVSAEELSMQLNIPASSIDLVLKRDWPVPPSWSAALQLAQAPEPKPSVPDSEEPKPPESEASKWAAAAAKHARNYHALGVALHLIPPTVPRSASVARFACPWCGDPGFLLYNMNAEQVTGACIGRCREGSKQLRLYCAQELIHKVTGTGPQQPGPPPDNARDPSLPTPAPMPRLPRGKWLAQVREKAGYTRHGFMSVLGGFATDLEVLEEHNLVVPKAWMETLHARGLCPDIPNSPATAHGSWIAAVRFKHAYSYAQVAARLGVPEVVVSKVECRNWPVPPEWVKSIRKMIVEGYQGVATEPEPAPELLAKPPAPAQTPLLPEPPPRPASPGDVGAFTLPEDVARDLQWLIPGRNLGEILKTLALRFIEQNQPILDRLRENQKLVGGS